MKTIRTVSFVASALLLPLALVFTATDFSYGAGPAMVRSGGMSASGVSRVRPFPHRFLNNGVGFVGNPGGDIIIYNESTPAAPPPQPAQAAKPANKGAYVPPHWVDTEYGVQVLQPGHWLDTDKLPEY